MITQDTTDEFINAWKESDGDSFSQRMARKSLIALARREPDLEPLLAQLEGGGRQHLNMRLTGEDVDDHWAPADVVGAIFKDAAEAVKELAKGISGKNKWRSGLAVLAPSSGSLRLSFSTEPTARQLTLEEKAEGTVDDQALIQFGQLFGAAASGSDSLSAIAANMNSNAVIPVRRITEQLVKHQWCVDFAAFGPFHDTQYFVLNTKSSQALLETLKVEKKITTPHTVRGILDGWRWSEGSMYVIPNAGKKFSAAVPVPLQHQVARLAATKGVHIEALFNKVVVNNINRKRTKHTAYELVSIEEVHSAEFE